MTIKNDLSSLKAGDKVFSTREGEVSIRAINGAIPYSIKTAHSSTVYTISGLYHRDDKHPSLFLSAKHASEYFASIKEKKQIHIKYYVHDCLNSDGSPYQLISKHDVIRVNIDEIYLGYTEINKTYEIEE